MIRRPPRSTLDRSSAASDVYKRQGQARIRVQLSAAHEQSHLEKAIAAFAKVGKELGVCLLYTSPSPRDRTRSRMPSSA